MSPVAVDPHAFYISCRRKEFSWTFHAQIVFLGLLSGSIMRVGRGGQGRTLLSVPLHQNWRLVYQFSIAHLLQSPPLEILLFSYASYEGWRTHLEDLLTSWLWDHHEKQHHINTLELKAAFLALHEFQERVTGHSVVLMSDNTTVVAYVNKWGRGASVSSTSRLVWLYNYISGWSPTQ